MITDTDWANVKNHTVEIEVYMAAELNVEPIIAIKRGLDLNSVVIAGSKMDKTAGNIFRKTAGMKNPHL